jgi:hypothetical protein
MIESYQHLKQLPDEAYAERKIPVSLKPGKKYKTLVNQETAIGHLVRFPHRLDDLLDKHYGISDESSRRFCCDSILNISGMDDIDKIIRNILAGIMDDHRAQTARYQLKDWVKKAEYIRFGQSYHEYMRRIFLQVIRHNICKANRIQNNQYEIADDDYRKRFDSLDLIEILKIQNKFSKDEQDGFIWVLNTCVFFVAEYNFALLAE